MDALVKCLFMKGKLQLFHSSAVFQMSIFILDHILDLFALGIHKAGHDFSYTPINTIKPSNPFIYKGYWSPSSSVLGKKTFAQVRSHE